MTWVLDAGVFIAIEQGDRRLHARLRVAQQLKVPIETSPFVVAQIWRSGSGSQSLVAQFLKTVEVGPVDREAAKEIGRLLATAGTDDPVDAAVALLARTGDQVFTSDPEDIACLLAALGTGAQIVDC